MKKRTLPFIAIGFLSLTLIITIVNLGSISNYEYIYDQDMYKIMQVLYIGQFVLVLTSLVCTIIAVAKNSQKTNFLYLIAAIGATLMIHLIVAPLLYVQFFKKPELNPFEDPNSQYNFLNQPMNNMQQPMNNMQQPMNNMQQPMNNMQQPMNNMQQPMNNMQQPMNQPMQATDAVSTESNDSENNM